MSNNKNEEYVIALDVSLSSTGGCIFDKNGNPVKLFNIPTSSKIEHGKRLKIIVDCLCNIRKEYDIKTAIFESGFCRFGLSTQAVFKAMGVANYVFYDCEQITYSPSQIKKIICGKGSAEKSQVQDRMKKIFPNLSFYNYDESDACAIGYVYFSQKE